MADAREQAVWTNHAAEQLRIGAYAPDPAGKDYLSRWLGMEPWATVLDFGCGTGLWRGMFRSGRYVGVDQNPAMIEGARQRHGSDGEFVLCPGIVDGVQMPFEDGTFDVAFTAACLQHNRRSDQEKVLQEIRRVLHLGGRLVLFENTYWAGNPGQDDQYSHTQEGWRQVVEPRGFACIVQEGDRHLFRTV